MESLKEWAKPAVVIVAIGLIVNCQNQRFDSLDNRLQAIDSRLQTIDERTFEMNTRLSRIEGKLGSTASAPNEEMSPSVIKE